MHRSHVTSSGQAALFRCQSWADYTTNTFGKIGTLDSLVPNGVLTEVRAIIQDTAIYSAISMT